MKITKTTHRLLALPAAVMVLALTTTGCSIVVEDGPKGQSSEQSTTAPTTTEATPAEETEPQPTEGGEAEPSDSGGDTEAPAPSDGGGEEKQDPKVEKVDLSPESETAVVYLRAIQGFSPELEVWTIDEEKGMVEYRRYNCLGSAQGIGVGSFTPREDGDEGDYLITWEGESPMPASYGSGQQEWATLTERTLEVGTNVSSTHHDIELERFGGMCKDTGEMVAGFVL